MAVLGAIQAVVLHITTSSWHTLCAVVAHICIWKLCALRSVQCLYASVCTHFIPTGCTYMYVLASMEAEAKLCTTGRSVYLDLTVKVKPKWRKDVRLVSAYGA